MGVFWLIQKVENENMFLRNIRQRLTDIYRQEWHASVQGTSNNRLYKYLKDSLSYENYLDLPNQYLRTAITIVRLSSHLYHVERGRWRNVPFLNRLCDFCNVTEDEYHVFIECPRYKKLRDTYLPNNLISKPSMHSFIDFLKCRPSSDLMKLGRLCAGIEKEHKLYI